MEFKEIIMSVEMNSFIDYQNDEDDYIIENENFKSLRQELDIEIDICEIHRQYYSNNKVGFDGNVKVFFPEKRMDTFISFDLGSESDGYDQIQMIIRYQKNRKVKALARSFFDRTKNDFFYQEGATVERNSQKITELKAYPYRVKLTNVEYFKDIEFYRKGIKLKNKIDLSQIYIWPFTKEE